MLIDKTAFALVGADSHMTSYSKLLLIQFSFGSNLSKPIMRKTLMYKTCKCRKYCQSIILIFLQSSLSSLTLYYGWFLLFQVLSFPGVLKISIVSWSLYCCLKESQAPSLCKNRELLSGPLIYLFELWYQTIQPLKFLISMKIITKYTA